MKQIAEYRGCENLVAALVSKDDSTGYETGEVFSIAGLAEVGVTTEQGSETKYYDNNPALVLKGVGAETRKFTIDHLTNSMLAKLTGQQIDTTTGAILGGGDGVTNPYFAVGYVSETTDGVKTYKWALKGTFQIPDETNTTKNAGTDSNNMSLVYTGIATTHKFTNGGRKVYVALEDTKDDGTKLDLSEWFKTVQTPDTLSSFAPTPSA